MYWMKSIRSRISWQVYQESTEQVKIDRRTSSALIMMDEVKKRLKERYLQLKREHGWSEDEMDLRMKGGINQNKNIKIGSKGKSFKGRCNHCGKFGHKKADCWDLKNKKEKHQENEKNVQKDKSKVKCFKCGKLGHYANECRSDKESSGGGNNETFAMTCLKMKKIIKMRMGMMKTSLNQRILNMMKEKWVLEHPGILKNPKEPHRRSRTFLRLKS